MKKDSVDLAYLRSLTNNDVLLVTKAALMRGYDYRCETGMVLFIAKRMNSDKAF